MVANQPFWHRFHCWQLENYFTDLKIIDISRFSKKSSLTAPSFIQICVDGCHFLKILDDLKSYSKEIVYKIILSKK